MLEQHLQTQDQFMTVYKQKLAEKKQRVIQKRKPRSEMTPTELKHAIVADLYMPQSAAFVAYSPLSPVRKQRSPSRYLSPTKRQLQQQTESQMRIGRTPSPTKTTTAAKKIYSPSVAIGADSKRASPSKASVGSKSDQKTKRAASAEPQRQPPARQMVHLPIAAQEAHSDVPSAAAAETAPIKPEDEVVQPEVSAAADTELARSRSVSAGAQSDLDLSATTADDDLISEMTVSASVSETATPAVVEPTAKRLLSRHHSVVSLNAFSRRDSCTAQ
eukprot:TRINITY_DN3217_c0_g4_i1.p2 TRINITY_DN3217_c0_g4~~TRINITY_DN3217_c0_g4_i1.p2  ORF type:complete len:274 (-),score=77.05 TRINITY_DN3217_c0_g4_i1:116-937(-)